jgi:protein phosphatase
VLHGDRDIAQAGKRLIDLANTHNGHDNVTVGLLQLSPKIQQPVTAVSANIADLMTATPLTQPPPQPTQQISDAPADKTPENVPVQRPAKTRPAVLLLTSAIVAVLLGIAAAIAWQWFARRSLTEAPLTSDAEGETLSPTAPPPTALEDASGRVDVGDFLQLRLLPDPSAAATVLLSESPPASDSAAADLPERLLPPGSIVLVESRQQAPNDRVWVSLKVCSVTESVSETTTVPEATTSSSPPADPSAEAGDRVIRLTQPGDQGWLLEADLSSLSQQVPEVTPAQRGSCPN